MYSCDCVASEIDHSARTRTSVTTYCHSSTFIVTRLFCLQTSRSLMRRRRKDGKNGKAGLEQAQATLKEAIARIEQDNVTTIELSILEQNDLTALSLFVLFALWILLSNCVIAHTHTHTHTHTQRTSPLIATCLDDLRECQTDSATQSQCVP
jgi:hypothetical protein